MSTPSTILRLLRPQQVSDRIGIGRAALYDMVARGKFPAPTRLSHKVSVWRESEINEWIEIHVPALKAATPQPQS